MTIEKFLEKWYNKRIDDWGSETSPEYKNFQTNYRSVIKDFCKDIDMELHSFSKNHYEFSAVIKSNKTGKFYYISISDVRFWKNQWAEDILYRTMKHDKDWSGGSNCYSTLRDLPQNLLNLDLRILKETENARNIDNQVVIENYDLDMNYI